MIEFHPINIIFYGPILLIGTTVIMIPFHLGMKYIVKKYTKKTKHLLHLLQFLIVIGICLYQPSAEAQFNTHLKIEKPNGVKQLKAYSIRKGDSASTYIKFIADSDSIKPIIDRGLSKNDTPEGMDFSEFKKYRNTNAPKWWNPQISPNMVIYKQERKNIESYDIIVETMLYDKITNEVHIKIGYVD